MRSPALLIAAHEVADAATGRALAEAYHAHGQAVSAVQDIHSRQPADMTDLSAALGRALTTWVQVQVCSDLHFGVKR